MEMIRSKWRGVRSQPGAGLVEGGAGAGAADAFAAQVGREVASAWSVPEVGDLVVVVADPRWYSILK